jgi:hypothetical protein
MCVVCPKCGGPTGPLNTVLLRGERQISRDLARACRVVLTYLDRLEDGVDEDDPLKALRRKFHGPLRDMLKPAIAAYNEAHSEEKV